MNNIKSITFRNDVALEVADKIADLLHLGGWHGLWFSKTDSEQTTFCFDMDDDQFNFFFGDWN